jgi:hypothetical protein
MKPQREVKAQQPVEIAGLLGVEAAGIEPAPGGAKPLAESRPYLVTARNDSESRSRRVPFRPVLFRSVPHVHATYVQHGGRGARWGSEWALGFVAILQAACTAYGDAGLSVTTGASWCVSRLNTSDTSTQASG